MNMSIAEVGYFTFLQSLEPLHELVLSPLHLMQSSNDWLQ